VLWVYVGIAFGIGGITWLFYVGAGLALLGLIVGIVAAVLNGRLSRQEPVPDEEKTTPKSETQKRKVPPRKPAEPQPTPSSPTTPTDTPVPAPEALPNGHFLFTKNEFDQFSFQLMLETDDVVLPSEDFPIKQTGLRGLRAVRHSALLAERYRRETAGQRHYFVLLDSENQVIAASPMFPTAQACNTFIEYAKALAFRASFIDETRPADTTGDEQPAAEAPSQSEPRPDDDQVPTKAKEETPETVEAEAGETAAGDVDEETAVSEQPAPISKPVETEPDLTLLPQTKAPKFQLFRGKDKEFYFRLVARNGETILGSEGYKRKASGVNGIRSVKKNALLADQFRAQVADNGLFYFTLVARNHEVIGMSELYTSTQSRDDGITAVSRIAWDAPIEDLTGEVEDKTDEEAVPPPVSKVKKAKKRPAAKARFQIFQGDDEQYYFHLRAANGEIILASEGYTTQRGCENGVRSVQKNGPLAERYVPETAENGQFYFKLLAGNHKVIGISELYTTRQNREKGITAVKQASPTAEIQHTLDK
jgi:uncharacterized protein YegP (UPF0339 family)